MACLNSKKAQSMIEYVTVATLVMIGILVMGPYVTRSINALFKNIEDDLDDSFKEEMVQGDPNVEVPECFCTNLIDIICGGGPCDPRQMYMKRDCFPAGCEMFLPGYPAGVEDCQYRDYCCTDWAETGVCGILAGCPNGEMQYRNECGGDASGPATVNLVCQHVCAGQVGCPDPPHPSCIFYCIDTAGNIVTPLMLNFAAYCPNDQTDLIGNTIVTFVPNGGCTDPPECQAECYPGYVPSGTGWGCECPPHSHPVGNTCVCDPGYFFRDGCAGSSTCLRDGCPAGQCYGVLM